MTFVERYHAEATWYGKVIVIEIYHLAMCQSDKTWNITKTATAFNLSIGLISENLQLADALHSDDKLINCPTRLDALKRIKSYGRNMAPPSSKRL